MEIKDNLKLYMNKFYLAIPGEVRCHYQLTRTACSRVRNKLMVRFDVSYQTNYCVYQPTEL